MKRIYQIIIGTLMLVLACSLADMGLKVQTVLAPTYPTRPATLVPTHSLDAITPIPTATPIKIKVTPTIEHKASATHTPANNLFGSPSLTANQIETILIRYKSPAVGNGKAFWDLGVKYNIDPAYLLAFFVKESTMGTDPNWGGIRNKTHNIGNIICTSNWQGGCAGRFRKYNTWAEGAEDWYSLMHKRYAGLTLPQIVAIYAPASDGNNPVAYTKAVRVLVQKWRAM